MWHAQSTPAACPSASRHITSVCRRREPSKWSGKNGDFNMSCNSLFVILLFPFLYFKFSRTFGAQGKWWDWILISMITTLNLSSLFLFLLLHSLNKYNGSGDRGYHGEHSTRCNGISRIIGIIKVDCVRDGAWSEWRTSACLVTRSRENFAI